jgi:AAA+ superfamily predicted ATPase
MRSLDVGVFLITETLGELNQDILSNPHIAQIELGLPSEIDRIAYLESEWSKNKKLKASLAKGGIEFNDLGRRTSGLNLIRVRNLILEAIHNDIPISSEYVALSKKRLIEEYCQGLVRFKEPVPGRSLEMVATHEAAIKKLKELSWLIKNGKGDVLEKGVLIPGRIGVGKSWLVDCFASECGLPVLEMGEFRSKWVGDTERQLARILLTLKALGPVIVVVDEADQVFGSSRASSSGDSGVSGRVFAAFAAHIGDSSLRGRELWFAMTSRPDLLAIDMKRQGRFGLCIPLFPTQNTDEVVELFSKIAGSKGLAITTDDKSFIREHMGDKEMTGSEVESIVIRSMESAVLAKRNKTDVSAKDFKEAVEGYIDSLDPNLIELQILAGVVSCSDKRYLPEKFKTTDMSIWHRRFEALKMSFGG